MPENYITVAGGQGSLHISEDVVASIVSAAILEVEGVAGLTGADGPDWSERLGFRSATRGIRILSEDGVVKVDAVIQVRQGRSIASIGEKAQQAAVSAVESMIGLPCEANIHVAGITFDK